MPLVEEDAIDNTFHGLIERGIFKNDIRGFTTQFKRNPFLLVPATAR
jgi:hypothetical protein